MGRRSRESLESVDPDFIDPDEQALNSGEEVSLNDAPALGGGYRQAGPLFGGDDAVTAGRATVPPLWEQAAQHPTVTQLQVFKIENGQPSGLGAIDASASEEDFVAQFIDAMNPPPAKDTRFRIRPIDINGRTIGNEFTKIINNSHITLKAIRNARDNQNSQPMNMGGWGAGFQGFVPDSSDNAALAEVAEAYRSVDDMKERIRQSQEAQLAEERRIARELEQKIAEERVRQAQAQADLTREMTERVLKADAERHKAASEDREKTQSMTLGMIHTMATSQVAGAKAEAERAAQIEKERSERERAFFERQSAELEARRAMERKDAEERHRRDMQDAEEKRRRDREEWEQKQTALREEAERKKAEIKEEADRRLQQEKLALEMRLAAEKAELELRREAMRLDAEKLKMEAEARRREDEEKRRHEMELFERKMRIEKEEAERRETLRREELARESQRRKEEHEMVLKQLEISREREREAMAAERERDKEHQQRMLELARIEREAAREAQAAREKADREAREAAEAERTRRHELHLKELDMAAKRDHEHAERMMSLSKAQNSGGLSVLQDMLGMNTPDILSRVFGGGSDESSGGWADAIPKILVGLSEAASKFVPPPQISARQPRQISMSPVPIVQGSVVEPPPKPRPAAQRPKPAQAEEIVDEPRAEPPAKPRPTPQKTSANKVEAPTQTPTQAPTPTQAQTSTNPASNSDISNKLKEASKIKTFRLANEAGIKMPDQTKARSAIKELLKEAATTDESKWGDVIKASLISNPSLVPYLKAVSIYGALSESKVELALAERVVKLLVETQNEFIAQGIIKREDRIPLDMAEMNEIKSENAKKLAAADEAEAKALLTEVGETADAKELS